MEGSEDILIQCQRNSHVWDEGIHEVFVQFGCIGINDPQRQR